MSGACPYCAEPIEIEGSQCPQCGERLSGFESAAVEDAGPPPERPRIVTFYALGNTLLGGLWVVLGLGLGCTAVTGLGSGEERAAIGGVMAMFAAVLLAAPSIPFLILGLGLFRLKQWARIGSVVMAGLNAAGQLLFLVWVLPGFASVVKDMKPIEAGGAVGVLVLSGLALLYFASQVVVLLLPRIAEAFRRT